MEEEKRSAELLKVVEHFKGKVVAQNVLDEYCNRMKFEQVNAGNLEDLMFQVDHDDKMALLLADIIVVLKDLKFVPALVSQTKRKKLEDSNEELRITIINLIEKHGISALMLERIGATLKDIIGSPIEMAGTTVYNKSMTVMRTITQNSLGQTNLNEFNSTDIAEFYKKVEEEYAKKSKDSDNKDVGEGKSEQ